MLLIDRSFSFFKHGTRKRERKEVNVKDAELSIKFYINFVLLWKCSSHEKLSQYCTSDHVEREREETSGESRLLLKTLFLNQRTDKRKTLQTENLQDRTNVTLITRDLKELGFPKWSFINFFRTLVSYYSPILLKYIYSFWISIFISFQVLLHGIRFPFRIGF